MNWPFFHLFKKSHIFFFCFCFYYCSLSHRTPSEYPLSIVATFSSASPCCFHGDQVLPFQLLHSSLSLKAVLSHDCAQFWFLKVPTHFWNRDILTKTSQFNTEFYEGRSRVLPTRESQPQHTLEKQALKELCVMGAGEMHPVARMQPALRWWHVTCVTSELKIP